MNKYKAAFETIEARIMAGIEVSKADAKFYRSYLSSIKNTKAGNAGKRRPTKTGTH